MCSLKKELDLRQRRWLELLMNYDMSMLYHQVKNNVVVEVLSMLSMEITSHVKEEKMVLSKDVQRLAR